MCGMDRVPAAALLVALAGCAMLPAPGEPARPAVTTARAVHLARVRCLLVAPFENASDDPLAAEAATGTFLSAIDSNRTRVYPVAELRALFKDTSLELPEGVSPSLALELAELIGADAALYGAVEGRSRGGDAALSVTIRLAATGARDLLFAKVVEVQPRPEESTAELVRRTLLEASGPMLERLGVPGRKACFDRQRTDRLRLMALAGEQRGSYPQHSPVTAPLPPAPVPVAPLPPPPALAQAAPAPLPAPPTPPEVEQTAVIGAVEILAPLPKAPPRGEPVVESADELPVESEAGSVPEVPEPPRAVALPQPPPESPAVASAKPPAKKERKARTVAAVAPEKAAAADPPPGPKSMTVRQADWLTRLQTGDRVLVEEVAFTGRTAQLEKEAGLADVVALLGVAPGIKLRIEGFVDASSDPDGDLRLSMEMARAAGKRLIELGVARDRLTWAGRGGESPILPNFTARGRMANRRVELLEAR
jgi:outer membrane protein OmpA-like peptidoglycan-associated protein